MQLTKRQALALVKVIDKQLSYLNGDAAQELVELQGKLEGFVLSNNDDDADDAAEDDDEPKKAWSDDDEGDGYDGLRCEEDENDFVRPNDDDIEAQVSVSNLVYLDTARSCRDAVVFARSERHAAVDLSVGTRIQVFGVLYLKRSAQDLQVWDATGSDYVFPISKFPPEWTALLPCNSLVEVVSE